MEVLTSHVRKVFCVVEFVHDWGAEAGAENSGFEERPPRRPDGQSLAMPSKYTKKLPHMQNLVKIRHKVTE